MHVHPGFLAGQQRRCELRRAISYWTNDSGNRVVECRCCGQRWVALFAGGGRFYSRWWACPNGCNADT